MISTLNILPTTRRNKYSPEIIADPNNTTNSAANARKMREESVSARKAGPSGQVHAFEPTPEVACRLRQNVEMNSFQNVVVNEMAVHKLRIGIWIAQ